MVRPLLLGPQVECVGERARILDPRRPEFVIDEASAANADLLAKVRGIAQEGSRVVALVHADEAVADDELPVRRSVAALVVLEEDLRPDAAETLDYFRSQDVHVRVISGDNPTTVGALAAQAGLTAPDGTPARLMDARDLPEDLTSEAFIDAIENHDVFGRGDSRAEARDGWRAPGTRSLRGYDGRWRQ